MSKNIKSSYSFFKKSFFRRPWLATLALLSIILGLLTYSMLGRLSYVQKGEHFVIFLLILDLACLSALTILIIKRLVKVWISKREGEAGSRLHGQMVFLFGVIAAVPTLILTLFSAVFFHFGVQEWFDTKFSKGLANASIISQAYFDEKKQQLGENLSFIAQELEKRSEQWSHSPENLQIFSNILLKLYKLDGLVVYTKNDLQAQSKGELSQEEASTLDPWFQKPYRNIPNWAQELVAEGNVAVLENAIPGFMGGVYQFLSSGKEYYLLIWKRVQKDILQYALQTKAAARDYDVLKSKKFEIQVAFSIIFAFVSLLILLGAIAVGLIVANALVKPISNLIKGVQRVSYGELDTFIPLPSGVGDLKVLVKAFNHMVKKLREQKLQLLSTNRDLEERKIFIESVLEGVSSGIIELSIDGYVRIINNSALKLLNKKKRKNKIQLKDIFPQAQKLFLEVLEDPSRVSQGNIIYSHGGQEYTFLVRVSSKGSQKQAKGYVLTFDDITEQISAERQAAWAEIAKRIAHEIKNPLTPIQLSAERLKRRYLSQLDKKDTEVFKKCIDVIIRQVETIGAMVSEFSSFARMPEMKFKVDNITELLRDIVSLQEQAYPKIKFYVNAPQKDIYINIDRNKMTQVFNNLLKNAIESIQEHENSKNKIQKIRCEIVDFPDKIFLIIEDTGKGWGEIFHNKLVEPYFTTRIKGTGLGLSIVSRIMKDHKGFIYFEESKSGGARVRLLLYKEEHQGIVKEEIE